MFAALCAGAQVGYRSLTIEATTPPGQVIRVQLDGALSIRYDYGMLQVSGINVFVMLPLDMVGRWTFSREAIYGVVGIDDASVEPQMTQGNGLIQLSGLPASTAVALYDTAGREMRALLADGDCEVCLDGLPTGMYVLVAGSSKFKIMVR